MPLLKKSALFVSIALSITILSCAPEQNPNPLDGSSVVSGPTVNTDGSDSKNEGLKGPDASQDKDENKFQVINENPFLEVSYPPLGTKLIGEKQTQIVGRVAYGSGITANKLISSMTVNNEQVDEINWPMSGAFSHKVDLELGVNSFDIEVYFNDGSMEKVQHRVFNDPFIGSQLVSIDEYKADELLLTFRNMLGRLDASSGEVDVILPSSETRESPLFGDLSFFDRTKNMIFSISMHSYNEGRITSYDIETKEQKIISEKTPLSYSEQLRSHCSDPDSFLNISTGSQYYIREFNSETGDSRVIVGQDFYGESHGQGRLSNRMKISECSNEAGVILFADDHGILSVDLKTGTFNEVSYDLDEYIDDINRIQPAWFSLGAEYLYVFSKMNNNDCALLKVKSSTGKMESFGKTDNFLCYNIPKYARDDIAIYEYQGRIYEFSANDKNLKGLYDLFIGSGVKLPDSLNSLSYNAANNELLVTGTFPTGLASINMGNSERTLISEYKQGSLTESLDQPFWGVFNQSTQTYFLTDRDKPALISIEAGTGERQVVIGRTDSGTVLRPIYRNESGELVQLKAEYKLTKIVEDFNNRSLIGSVPSDDRLIAIDLMTNEIRTITGPSRGAGPDIGYIRDFAYAAEGKAFIYDSQNDDAVILEVDAVTGNRKEVFQFDGDATPPNAILIKADENVVLYSDVETGHLIEVNLKTGSSQIKVAKEELPNGITGIRQMAEGPISQLIFAELGAQGSLAIGLWNLSINQFAYIAKGKNEEYSRLRF